VSEYKIQHYGSTRSDTSQKL